MRTCSDNMSDVTILVTSFLRPGCLAECMASIKLWLPDCKVIVIDDGDLPLALPDPGNCDWSLIRLPFDSGLSAKRNAGVKAATTKYVLLGCDDFYFFDAARKGIELLIDALGLFGPDNLRVRNSVVLASGRVDDNPYEGFLEYKKGEYIKETRADVSSSVHEGDCQLVDLTVNYFLARTEALKQFPWPEEMKIGGEHVCLFLDLKLAGKNVAWVKGVNVTTQLYDPSKQDPRYAQFRARAR